MKNCSSFSNKSRNVFSKKRGFSLVETIIAMAIVTLVTVGAMSTALFADKAALKEKQYGFAINETENLLKCFQNSDNITEFDASINFLFGTINSAPVLVEDENYAVANGTDFTTYYFYYSNDGEICQQESSQWYIRLNIDPTTEGNFGDNCALEIIAYSKGGNRLYAMSNYKKA